MLLLLRLNLVLLCCYNHFTTSVSFDATTANAATITAALTHTSLAASRVGQYVVMQ